MSDLDHRFYEQAHYLINRGYMPGQHSVEELAVKLRDAHLAYQLEQRKKNPPTRQTEEVIEDGVSVTVLDSRPQ